MIRVKITKTFDNSGKLKALMNVHLDNFMLINGCKLFETEKGRFVSMPNQQYNLEDGTVRYKDIITIESQELKDSIEKYANIEYENILNNQKVEETIENTQEQMSEILPWDK